MPNSGAVIRGMAFNLEKEFVGAVLFGNDAALKEGDCSCRTEGRGGRVERVDAGRNSDTPET